MLSCWASPAYLVGADVMGLEPGFVQGVTGFRQSLLERGLLYLDKAWPYLQRTLIRTLRVIEPQ
jgi:hypothetical protein